MFDLANLLHIEHAQAIGHLTALWDFAGESCPGGGIGVYPDSQIAVASLWRKDPGKFVQALATCHWIDPSETFRYGIHAWNEHCEEYVHKRLRRNRQTFWNGAKPYQRNRIDGATAARQRRDADGEIHGLPRPRLSQAQAKPSPGHEIHTAARELVELLASKILTNNPKAKAKSASELRAWERQADLLFRNDERDPEEARRVLEWSQGDFADEGRWKGWATVILSMGKFRKHYDTLRQRMEAQHGKAIPNTGQRNVANESSATDYAAILRGRSKLLAVPRARIRDEVLP